MSRTYHVTWKIEVEADSPIAAARKALAIQRDRTSSATVFEVSTLDHGVLGTRQIIDLAVFPLPAWGTTE